ncbi:MAG: archaetidylserine decarboxylase [Candidatus Polarisedimenticolaceae bacterium]|nr:archaetidylserine decarboxylase [Candidatus Polarisedimenticolaceae bacterium]
MRILQRLFVLLQYLLPHHLLSYLMHQLARTEWIWLKNLLIKQAVSIYRVNMDEAAEPNPERYRSFNDFFTRKLVANARPIAEAKNVICSPVDGAVSQFGEINNGRIFQAKGHDYSLQALLGGDAELSACFDGGSFATIYLSPKDYHRIHMPLDGELKQMIHVPGRLFSVNATTTEQVPRLFAQNERVVSIFETEVGPVAVILVGAIFVASIDTVWAGAVAPKYRGVQRCNYADERRSVSLSKGAEMGRFNMGSTVILLFGKESIVWDGKLSPGVTLRMGEQIATLQHHE